MKIGEMERKTGISPYTLRYYEKKGLIRVNRDEFGRRNYEELDVKWVVFIKKLKDTGMLLRDIKKYSDLRYRGDSTMEERLTMLVSHREIIVEEQRRWANYLDNIDNKIEIYKENLQGI